MRPVAAPKPLRRVVVLVVFLIAILPSRSEAAGCDEWLNQTVRLTGSYVPSGESYARRFVFAMLVDCKGGREVVTVQRATGTFPVCGAQESVAVVGKLVWNRALVQGHYEITNPTSVTCEVADREPTTGPAVASGTAPSSASAPPVAKGTPAESTPGGSSVPVAPVPVPSPQPQAKTVGPSVWVGRYQDSRGAGDVTLTLLRGESTVSGTWQLRTGGGGPITGMLEPDGRRMTFRMENIAGECRGTFDGSSELTDTTLVATYRGKDCEGPVNDGRLELRLR
jgi:hypothetical protein